MDVKKHSYHFGNYKMSVYATMGNGIFTGVCAGSQTINPDNYLYSKYVSASQREVWLLGANAEQVQFLHGVKQTVRMISFGIVVLTEETVHGVLL